MGGQWLVILLFFLLFLFFYFIFLAVGVMMLYIENLLIVFLKYWIMDRLIQNIASIQLFRTVKSK